MAEKFGKARWVKEGYLDNRTPGYVVGRITFAILGAVDVYLKGDFKSDIAGKAFRFRNSGFMDEELAGHVLGDFEVPQVGEVSLISFDPHPLLSPHPYIEWFSVRKNHYRIELIPEDAWLLDDAEACQFDETSRSIREALQDQVRTTRERNEEDWV